MHVTPPVRHSTGSLRPDSIQNPRILTQERMYEIYYYDLAKSQKTDSTVKVKKESIMIALLKECDSIQ